MIILGSTSPRRKNLLNKITSDFKIIAPLFNEKTLPLNTKHYALEESYNKAKSLESKIIIKIKYMGNQRVAWKPHPF